MQEEKHEDHEDENEEELEILDEQLDEPADYEEVPTIEDASPIPNPETKEDIESLWSKLRRKINRLIHGEKKETKTLWQHIQENIELVIGVRRHDLGTHEVVEDENDQENERLVDMSNQETLGKHVGSNFFQETIRNAIISAIFNQEEKMFLKDYRRDSQDLNNLCRVKKQA